MPQPTPFHLRQRFRIRELDSTGVCLQTTNARGTKAAAEAAGVSVLYLKRKLAESDDDRYTRKVLREDGTWGYVLVERLERLY